MLYMCFIVKGDNMDPISILIYIIIALVVMTIFWLIIKRLPLPSYVAEITMLIVFLVFLWYISQKFNLL